MMQMPHLTEETDVHSVTWLRDTELLRGVRTPCILGLYSFWFSLKLVLGRGEGRSSRISPGTRGVNLDTKPIKKESRKFLSSC